MRRELITGAIIAALALGACGGGSGDASAELACSRFATVARDFTDDQLTPSELRGRLQDIELHASASDDEELAAAARDMVAGATGGSDSQLAAAVNRFGQACEAGDY